MVHTVALQCQRNSSCARVSANPEALIRDTVVQLRDHPIDGTPSKTPAKPIHLDDLAMAAVLAQADPGLIVAAATKLAGGDAQPLLDLASDNPQFAPFDSSDTVTPFSWGANLAGWCNDQDVPWARTDPIPARNAAYDAYLAGLAPDAFAPFSIAAWSEFNFMDQCLTWPAPTNFTPAVPAGTTMPSVPVLILSGDEDNGVPLGFSQALLDEFPQATLVQVAGAGHPTMSMDGLVRAVDRRRLPRDRDRAGHLVRRHAWVTPDASVPRVATSGRRRTSSPGSAR